MFFEMLVEVGGYYVFKATKRRSRSGLRSAHRAKRSPDNIGAAGEALAQAKLEQPSGGCVAIISTYMKGRYSLNMLPGQPSLPQRSITSRSRRSASSSLRRRIGPAASRRQIVLGP